MAAPCSPLEDSLRAKVLRKPYAAGSGQKDKGPSCLAAFMIGRIPASLTTDERLTVMHLV
ncbi:hypothetical protein F0U59_27350 [Archangium gephyra]|nr:hypothetical protein F0U59_27350 [Archangium gephyra]